MRSLLFRLEVSDELAWPWSLHSRGQGVWVRSSVAVELHGCGRGVVTGRGDLWQMRLARLSMAKEIYG